MKNRKILDLKFETLLYSTYNQFINSYPYHAPGSLIETAAPWQRLGATATIVAAVAPIARSTRGGEDYMATPT